jgi:glycosyltransferase involved in cell wall biosynthesis
MNISVYVTSYNQKTILIEAIESVLAQSLRPHEIIVVDDCSTDGSQAVIQGYTTQYPDLIIPIFHEQNLGVVHTRNDALKAATGDFVTYLDGDDRYLPLKLEKEAALLDQYPNADVAYSNYYFITENGDRAGVWAGDEKLPEGDIFSDVFSSNFPDNGMLLMEVVSNKALRTVGYYDTTLKIWEDLDWRIRLLKQYWATSTNEPLAEHRHHSQGLSSANSKSHYDALTYIYNKNKILLNDLPNNIRRATDRQRRKLLAKMARRVSQERLGQSEQVGWQASREAFIYYLDCLRLYPEYFSLSYTLQVILPLRLYMQLRALKNRRYTTSS